MNAWAGSRAFALMLLGLCGWQVSTAHGGNLAVLLAVYASQPQGYPQAKEFARPDRTAPFRWHFYHEEAIRRFEDATMDCYSDPYNLLEGGGIEVEKGSPVTFAFVGEHVTQGTKALRVEFPAAAIRAGKAAILIQGNAGPPPFEVGQMPTASCYWQHYRWLKLDVFNPSNSEVRVRVAHVPLVLHPGHNVVAVKTADAAPFGSVGHPRPGIVAAFVFRVTSPDQNLTLFLDNARMEQELPSVIHRKGKMFQWPGRSTAPGSSPMVWPGFTPVEASTEYTPERGFGWTDKSRVGANGWQTFRSSENGILWGWNGSTSPFRIDVPDGKYGIYVFAPGNLPEGATIEVNGQRLEFMAPLGSAERVREVVLGGERWDYRPGSCLWEELVRPPWYPHTRVVFAEARDGRLLIQPPSDLRVIMIFPEADREEALKEIGRFNVLLAESWDITHFWVAGTRASLAAHEEARRPEVIPERLRALKLTPEDFQRGFKLFHRGLTEPVYPDTIPTLGETAFQELRCSAAPGERECVTLGFLPLDQVKGLKVTASDLKSRDGQRIGVDQIDLRFSRYHQKVMQYGHHNHAYELQEHYLVKRPSLDLYPGAARRCYLDIKVPPDTQPGVYRGQVVVQDKNGQQLAAVPLVLTVLPIALQEPAVYFAGNGGSTDYGLNTLFVNAPRLESGAPPGLKGAIVYANYDWADFFRNRNVYETLLRPDQVRKGPRFFFGGVAPDTHWNNPKASANHKQFYDNLLKDFPGMNILGVTIPAYTSPAGPGQAPHEWMVFRPNGYTSTLPRGTPPVLEAAQKSGRDFWFVDGMRAKEHAGRFSFGLWLWRLGATGRYTPFVAHSESFDWGTAFHSHRLEPYYTCLGPGVNNVVTGWKESLIKGVFNPARDLLLVREGIDDYRYLYTLEWWLQQAARKKVTHPAVEAGRRFLDELRASISLDLGQYYTFFSGAYAEEWFVCPGNPWTTEKLDGIRRQAAEHVLALQEIVRK